MRERTHLALLLLTFAASAQTPQLPKLDGQPTCRLEGQVIDPVHQPVRNAEVVAEHDGVVIATTRTDGQGTFVFPRVPSQFVIVRATTDAPDIGAAVIDLWGEGRGFARVRTMPARKLSGTVRDDTGAPIPHAWVLAAPHAIRRDQTLACAHCRGRSDENGHYELPHVAMGPVNVRAWTPLHDAAAFEGTVDGTEDAVLDCTVARDGADWMTFRLENASVEQKATAELRVVAFYRGWQMPLPPELSRPKAVEPGMWDVCGWTTADQIHAWIVLDGATMWPGEHVVRPGVGTVKRRFEVGDADGRIAGQLIDGSDGSPVAGVHLLAQPLGSTLGAVNSVRRTAVSASDGTFSIQAPVDTDDAFAMRSMSPRSALMGNDANPVWFVAKHDADARWQLGVRPAETVRLHLDDVHGNPQFGTIATLWARGDRDQRLGNGTSSLDGSVEISCLRLDFPANLLVTAVGTGGIGQIETRVQGGNDVYLGRAKLEPAASVRGEVLDPEGSPVAGARVEVFWWQPGVHRPFVVVTNRAGRFRLRGLRPGRYKVSTPGSEVMPELESGVESVVSLVVAR